MTTSLPKPNTAYQACLDEGVKQASRLIRQWCSRLLDTLSTRSMTISQGAERHPVNHAMVTLMRNRMVFEHDFVFELKRAMADDALNIPAEKIGKPLRSLASLSFDDLELMGDHQVQETVERARLQQIVRLSCDAALSGFTARLSTIQGFAMVKADRNPLRPDIVLQTLLKVLERLPMAPEVRSCLLAEGSQIMGDELQSLYLSMDSFLARQGVAPAAYGVVSSPESLSVKAAHVPQARLPQTPPPVARAALKVGHIAAQEAMTLASRKKLLTLDHLHHLLAGDYEAGDDGASLLPGEPSAGQALQQELQPDFSPTLPAAFDVLSELQEKAPDTRQASRARPAPPLPVAQLRDHLTAESASLGQSLAVEVVGLMIEQITQDERLLRPVRQIIANAEPAFLRLAVTDTRFFSNKSHPARKLLEAITSTSLAYASETAPGFAGFMNTLQALAPQLTEEHAGDAQHFAMLLDVFERKLARSTPESRQAEIRAVEALLHAEQRNLLAEKIAAQIRRRPGVAGASRIVSAFLTGPWAQVMAREQLLAEEGDALAQKAVFGRALDDLLWSLDLAQVAGQRPRLLQLIPGLLKSLRDGLLSIDYPLAQSKAFFDELMALHQIALRAAAEAPVATSAPVPTPAPAATPALAAPGRHALEKLFEVPDDPGMSPPWLAPAEAQHSGFMEDWANSLPGTDEPDTGSADAAPAPAGQDVQLHQGAWVEMLVETQWLRAQLTWISPHDTLYMFISEGGRKHSMTNRVLHHLLALGFVKVISDQGVLERALDSVARTAMRNSVDGQSGF